MNIRKKFINIFNILLEQDKSNDIVTVLTFLNDNVLNTEIVLNIIKILVLVFYIDKNNYTIYYEYLLLLQKNTNDINFIVKKLNSYNLDFQMNIKKNNVNKIIILIHQFLTNTKITKTEILYLLIDIIKYTNMVKSSTNYKINVFKYFITDIIDIVNTNHTKYKSLSIDYMKNVVDVINKYIYPLK